MAISLVGLYVLSLLPGICKISINGSNINLFGVVTLLILPFLYARFFTEKRLITLLKKRKMIIFLICWLFIDIVGIMRALDLSQWIKYNYFFISGLSLAILVAYYFKEKKHYYYFLLISNVMLVIHNIIGWVEIIAKKYYFLSSEELKEIYIRYHYPVSMFGNTNDFAIFLTVAIFLTLIFNNLITNTLHKLLNNILIISSFFLIYRTQSRACWLALVVGLILFLLLKVRYTHKTYRVFFMLGIVATLSVISSITYFIITSNVIDLNSIGMRINLIKNGFILLFQTWGFGVGSSNIELLMHDSALLPTAGMSNMHNWWMEILVSFGIVIFTIYLFIYVKFILTAFKAVLRSEGQKEQNINGLIFSLLFVFTIACISSSSINSYGWIWILYGCCISFYYCLEN